MGIHWLRDADGKLLDRSGTDSEGLDIVNHRNGVQGDSELESNGTPIGPLDTLIVAHARSLDATIVTNNANEFTGCGVASGKLA